MSNHKTYDCIRQARAERRCIVTNDKTQTQALIRRAQTGELTRVMRGIYAESEAWNGLNPQEQNVQLARALALQHPDWVFAGISAAAIHGLAYRDWLHQSDRIYIATTHNSPTSRHRRIQHILMPSIETTLVNKTCVTTLPRTLLDCAIRYDFRDALVMFDSALRRQRVTLESIAAQYQLVGHLKRKDMCKISALLQYSSPLSESVGESLCRGTMLSAGFPPPEQQVIHRNPTRPGHMFRTDFEFTSADGGTVIVEFDGAQKYIDPSMTDNRTLRGVVHDEQERERALLAEPQVKSVIRFNYDEVMQRTPVIRALTAAGVPRVQQNPVP